MIKGLTRWIWAGMKPGLIMGKWKAGVVQSEFFKDIEKFLEIVSKSYLKKLAPLRLNLKRWGVKTVFLCANVEMSFLHIFTVKCSPCHVDNVRFFTSLHSVLLYLNPISLLYFWNVTLFFNAFPSICFLPQYHKTIEAVYSVENSVETLLDLLQRYREKAGDKVAEKGGSIFTKACFLLALLLQDKHRAEVHSCYFTQKILLFTTVQERKPNILIFL